LWLKLKPYTETKTVYLAHCNIEHCYGCIEVTFILKGFGQQVPTAFMLSEGYIPIDKQNALPAAI
jgi:hypothetical protein